MQRRPRRCDRCPPRCELEVIEQASVRESITTVAAARSRHLRCQADVVWAMRWATVVCTGKGQAGEKRAGKPRGERTDTGAVERGAARPCGESARAVCALCPASGRCGRTRRATCEAPATVSVAPNVKHVHVVR